MAGNMQDNFDENGNPIRCSFCGKEQGQVRRLVKGPTNIFICDECVAACSEILEESLASDFMDAARNGNLPGFLNDHGQDASQPAADPETEGFELEDDRQVITHVPTPHEIYDELSAYVMGQEDAKRAMSVAVYNHYRRVIEGGAAVSAFDEASGMGAQFDDDIGFLPGDESEKIAPLLRPVVDNLELLVDQNEKERFADERSLSGKVEELFDRRIVDAQALNFIRGRSISKTYLVIDEAQNLTPKQAKGIITRAGMGTKIILLGDPQQIDHPLLDERTNGLSYAAEKMKGSPLCWQVTMSAEECERSALAMDAVKRM